ncbi:hypothetical protein C8R45DRAFT_1085135 [Mycena sanguinolenta]|nr:hypothetical protein C8R45DRAFT_1085135 [Mycena sanguinolenta]
MSAPPAKRKRTENAPVTITRSKRWFFDDGNVVLQAGNTQFRVHWGVLALHSSVFRGMQGLPQPPDQPSVDGCPVVELSDNPADVDYLLKALYIPAFHCKKLLSVPILGAFLRLGRKYEFKYLFDSAVARLTSECPATLKEYDALGKLKTIEWYSGVDLDLIALASGNNIFTALPCAYYRAVEQFTLTELFDGIRRKDGTLARLLSLDFRRCVVARERLLSKQFQEGYTFGWTRELGGSDTCTDSMKCCAMRENCPRAFLDTTLIGALLTWKALSAELCPACTRHAKEAMDAGRSKMWDDLPGIFDLPPWTELKNDP